MNTSPLTPIQEQVLALLSVAGAVWLNARLTCRWHSACKARDMSETTVLV
jgi:hypothetical protein